MKEIKWAKIKRVFFKINIPKICRVKGVCPYCGKKCKFSG